MAPVLKYGIVKERISALVTDALRAQLLEAEGYAVDILEFIDMEHTPKNLTERVAVVDHVLLQIQARDLHLIAFQFMQTMT